MTDDRKFKEYMTVLGELFDKPMSEMLMSLYWKSLEPFTDEECKRAFESVMGTARFFPKPADFLEILRGKDEDRATRAWILVAEAVRKVGNYESVEFHDPIVHSVFKFWGGWQNAGVSPDWNTSQLPWKQKEFERLYQIMAKNDSHPTYLPGQTETDNSARGYEFKGEIVKIGFPTKPAQKQIAGSEVAKK
jgi:hypothetical protein